MFATLVSTPVLIFYIHSRVHQKMKVVKFLRSLAWLFHFMRKPFVQIFKKIGQHLGVAQWG